MTPDDLRALLPTLPDAATDPHALLGALEARCIEAPHDRQAASALLAVHGQVTASDGLPPVVAGVRRHALIRWDPWTSTWEGTRTQTGEPAMVRVIRAQLARDPVLRRALQRDALALGAAWPDRGLVFDEGDWPAIRLDLPGPPLGAGEGPAPLARHLATALHDLIALEGAGLGAPVPGHEELRDAAEGARVACLTPMPPGDAGPALVRLAGRLRAWSGGGSPLEPIVEGLAELPPRSASEAAASLVGALATELAASRHRLYAKGRHVRHTWRKARLANLLGELALALPPPEGRGAVGVDLDGRVTVVTGREGTLSWGPAGDERPLVGPGQPLAVPEARRLLRASAAAPPNPRLDAQVGGQPGYAEAACRWLSSTLQLRTVRLLLDARR